MADQRIRLDEIVDGTSITVDEITGKLKSTPINSTLGVPNINPFTFLARPNSATTPAAGITTTQAVDLLSGAAQARTPENFGAVGNDIADDTAAIQGAIDFCVLNSVPLVLSCGKTYRITSMLQIGTGDAIAMLHMRGQRPGIIGAGNGTPTIHANFKTSCAINVQGARFVYLTGFAIVGDNVAPGYVPLPTVSSYLSGGVSNTRYAPYAGVVIDAFAGPDPGGGLGYPAGPHGGAYGKFTSSTVISEDMSIENFAVGHLNLGPGGNTEACPVHRCWINKCAVAVAVCESQSRTCEIDGNFHQACHTVYDSNTYGAQRGSGMTVSNACLANNWRAFNVNTINDTFVARKIYGEVQGSIGTIEGPEPALLESCAFMLQPAGLETQHPIVHGRFAALRTTLRNCSIQTKDHAYLNILGSSNPGQVVYDGCRFFCVNDPDATFHVADTITGGYTRTLVRDSAIGGGAIGVGGEATKNESSDTGSPGYRVPISQCSRWVRTGGVAANNLATDMRVVSGFPQYRAPGLATSGYAWVGGTLTFTAGTAGEFLIGDLLYWQALGTAGGGSPDAGTIADLIQGGVIGVKVTNVVGTTITAVAQGTHTELDKTTNYPTTFVAFNDWAPNVTLTATWTTLSKTIVIDPVYAGLLPGDFLLAAAGLPAIVRVVSNDGAGNVVLSKFPTVNKAAEPVYCSKLVAL